MTDESTLNSVFREIDAKEKTEVKNNEKIRYEERFQKPLVFAILLLLLEALLSRTAWRFAL